MTAPAPVVARPPTPALRRMLALFGRLRWWIVAAALLSAATLAAGIGLMSMAGYLISRSALVETTEVLALAVVGVRFFAVVRAVGRYLERYVGHLGTFRMLTRTRTWFFAGIEPLAPAALHDERSGDLLTRIVDDVDTLQDLPLRVMAPPVAAVVAGGVGAVVLGLLDPSLALVLVAFLVLCGVVLPMATRRWATALTAALAADRALTNATTVEGVTAMADLVAYGREDLFVDRLAELTERRRATEVRLARVRATNVALAGLLAGLAVVAALAFAVALVADGRLDGVLLAVVPLAVVATFEGVAPLAAAFEHADRSRAAAGRLLDLVDRPVAVPEPPDDGPHPVPSGAGRVEFDDVTFRYRPDRPAVLAGAGFTVPAGATAVVTGPSGAGKSTLAALLLRFWVPDHGTIRIDGVELGAMGSDAARAAVAVVAQHDHLFDTTIRDNLRLGDADADDERLWAVLAVVALDDVVRALPDGLGARAGEDGGRLSGGERQRLMVARALLAETPVLVLDEATAHLDAATEQRVVEGIAAWRAGRTTIHVAHHPPPALRPDVVLEVRDGRVTELPAGAQPGGGGPGASAG